MRRSTGSHNLQSFGVQKIIICQIRFFVGRKITILIFIYGNCQKIWDFLMRNRRASGTDYRDRVRLRQLGRETEEEKKGRRGGEGGRGCMTATVVCHQRAFFPFCFTSIVCWRSWSIGLIDEDSRHPVSSSHPTSLLHPPPLLLPYSWAEMKISASLAASSDIGASVTQ